MAPSGRLERPLSSCLAAAAAGRLIPVNTTIAFDRCTVDHQPCRYQTDQHCGVIKPIPDCDHWNTADTCINDRLQSRFGVIL